jgi:hypothetical protein
VFRGALNILSGPRTRKVWVPLLKVLPPGPLQLSLPYLGMHPLVNFTNILCGPFVSIFLHQKSTNLKFKYKGSARKTFVQKRRALNVGEIDTLVPLGSRAQILDSVI